MTTALVTGASSGIGAVFANQLAQRGHDLILVARSQDKLAAIAGDLNRQYGVQATVIAEDLTATEATARIFEEIERQGMAIEVLVNNAGYGTYGELAEGDLSNYLKMIQLNVSVLVDLTYRCLQGMKQRRSGSILNLSSTAAFQPIPYFATYAASKSFVLSFSEALWYECKPYDIKVLAVCPGPTKTEFSKTADFPGQMEAPPSQTLSSPDTVVEEALAALDRGDSNVVTGGLQNQILANTGRFLPREMLTNAVGRMFQVS